MLISHLHVRNLLSFGDKGLELPLQPLNVLVGPNGSGKSNVLEILNLVRALPDDVSTPIRENSTHGFEEWIWQGGKDQKVEIQASFYLANHAGIKHAFEFAKGPLSHVFGNEKIEYWTPEAAVSEFVYHYEAPHNPQIWDRNGEKTEFHAVPRNGKDPVVIDGRNSILTKIQDPVRYPALSYLAENYRNICLYRNWSFGRKTLFRTPQPADARKDFLAEDYSNIGLILNKLGRTPSVKKELINRLQDLYEGLDGYEVIIEGGTVQVFFSEGNFSIPATRLSDGTLRYLTLLAILLDPEPPKLIGLEEPELGLHPDLIPKVADLLIEASTRTQLIVTTHSDILIDALSEQPESVLVCEKDQGQTHIHRLQTEELTGWLKKYRLGELWTIGEIGGTRW